MKAAALAGLSALCLLSACGAAGGGGRAHAGTFCGQDGSGACPSLGRTAAGMVAPAAAGADREVQLAGHLTNDAVTTLAGGIRLGGLGGSAFPERAFPSSGSLALTVAGDQHVSFLIPAYGPGRPSAMSLARPETVAVPPGVYGALWLLEAGVSGNIGPMNIALRFAGGHRALVPVSFGDWCNGGFPLADAPPEYVGISLHRVLTTSAALAASSGTAGPGPAARTGAPLRNVRMNCGLWAEEVVLPPAAEPLAAITLPASPSDADPDAFVMAMTLQAGPAPRVPSSSS